METNATRMCALLVGLPAITVLGLDGSPGRPLRVHVETTDDLLDPDHPPRSARSGAHLGVGTTRSSPGTAHA